MNRTHIERGGHVVDDCVEQRLHTLVLEGGAVEDGYALATDGAASQRTLHVIEGDLFFADELLEDDLVEGGQRVDQLLAVLVGELAHIRGDVDDVERRAEFFTRPHDGPHAHEVDHARVARLDAYRQLDDRGDAAEALLDRAQTEVKIGTRTVHLVDEAHARYAVLVGLAPHRLGLRFDTRDTVEHRYCAVEHAERTLDLHGEVDVTGRVDDVDSVVVPECGGRGGRDGDAALALLLHPVHRGRTLVDLTDLVVATGVEEDPLGGGGLARVDVGHDPDVAGSFEGVAYVHLAGFLAQAGVCASLAEGADYAPRPGRCPVVTC